MYRYWLYRYLKNLHGSYIEVYSSKKIYFRQTKYTKFLTYRFDFIFWYHMFSIIMFYIKYSKCNRHF